MFIKPPTRMLHTSMHVATSERKVMDGTSQLQDKYNPDLWSATECSEDQQAACFMFPGRKLYRRDGHSGMSELLISVRKDYGTVYLHDTIEISQITYHRPGGSEVPPRCLCYVKVRRPSGKRILYITEHLPNTLGNTQFQQPVIDRERCYKDVVRNTVLWIKQHDNDVDAVVLAADFNARLDVSNEMKSFLVANMHGAGMELLGSPDHIDGFFGKGIKVKESDTLIRTSMSDHAPEYLRGTIKKKRK